MERKLKSASDHLLISLSESLSPLHADLQAGEQAMVVEAKRINETLKSFEEKQHALQKLVNNMAVVDTEFIPKVKDK
ncbi:uncharacterized protein VTP21DRAFT_4932 [Calcarisporiella thermophila]|uniref:uncharacterized protein n=1 Tax=Calcarisporiella thermophila TaxID=911321 RepID=UPI0037431E8A